MENREPSSEGIRSHRWSLKWVMHAMQTIRSNSFKCWRELNNIKDGKEDQCTKWSTDGTRKGNIEWSHHVGLTQGLITYIKQHRQCNPVMRNDTPSEDKYHIIANRGDEHRNVRCVVCLHEKKIMHRSSRANYKVRRSRCWCPHAQCRAHACPHYRLVVHDYFQQGILLRNIIMNRE